MTNTGANPQIGTVLIVDDDDVQRHLLRRVLETDGFRLAEASDGYNIMEVVEQVHPDIILLDAVMPGVDGFEICQMLQTTPGTERIPVLIITALEEDEYVDRAFAVGAVDYVTKPVNFAVLRQRVRRLFKMRQLEQMRDELTQMIVHDMKNPIATIRGFAEILLQDLSENAEAADLLQRIYHNSNHLLDMAMMLLDISRIEEGKLTLRPFSRNVMEVLLEVQDAFQWMAHTYEVSIEITHCPPSLEFALDWPLISRVLSNLTSNAIKHSSQGSVVEMCADVDANGLLYMAVSDHGEGISKEDQKVIFDKFKQATKKTKGSRTDTGLGLTFSKLATEAHGGQILLESAIGEGSTFTIVFPL